MRKEFINYIFVFDKTFGHVLTYQHKNKGSKPRSSWYQFQGEWIDFNKKLKFKKGTRGLKELELVLILLSFETLSQYD